MRGSSKEKLSGTVERLVVGEALFGHLSEGVQRVGDSMVEPTFDVFPERVGPNQRCQERGRLEFGAESQRRAWRLGGECLVEA